MKPLNGYDLFAGIDKHTTLKDDIVLWLGLRAGDLKAISFAYPNGFASTRYGKDTLSFARDYDFIAVERSTRTRTDSSLSELDPYISDFLSKFNGHNVHIVGYHSTPTLENIVSRFPNMHILNPPAKLKQKLDEKGYVREELIKRGVNIPQGHEAEISSESYNYLFSLMIQQQVQDLIWLIMKRIMKRF
jgi:hypothetical protein